MWEEELEVVKKCAAEAGKIIMRIYDKPAEYKTEIKADNSPVTLADKEANAFIVQTLKAHFPHYAILSEEEEIDIDRLQMRHCFIVDPLDGTKEFIKRNGQFTVNIALAYDCKTVMGVIYVPVTGEMYYASQGMGAFLTDANGKTRRIQVSKRVEDIRLVASSSHGCKEMEELIERNNITNIVRIGSSLKGCLVARGDAEAYYRYNPTKEWDTAAMQCIVEEAGGVFRQMDDSEMYYNRENVINSKGFYASNGIIEKL